MNVPPYHEYLGIRVDKGSGEATATLDLQPHHKNRRGVAHGGVISSLLDTALGAAVISSIPKEWWCATISLSLQFVQGARSGTLIGRGEVVRRGLRVAFARGTVCNEKGDVLATAEGTWHLWSGRPGAEPPQETSPFIVKKETGERLKVGKVLAVGRNYAKHVEEMGGQAGTPPILFLKPTSALLGDGGTVILPEDAGEVHHEVELVVVIGRSGRRIAVEDALQHVEGYAVGLDMTLRELQATAKKKGEPWYSAKGFDTSAPLSPYVPRDEVGDGSGLGIRLKVNGDVRQESSTSNMTRSVASLIAFASELVTLERGDLIYTGTPEGVGPVVDGDRLEASIDSIGSLCVQVKAEDSRPT